MLQTEQSRFTGEVCGSEKPIEANERGELSRRELLCARDGHASRVRVHSRTFARVYFFRFPFFEKKQKIWGSIRVDGFYLGNKSLLIVWERGGGYILHVINSYLVEMFAISIGKIYLFTFNPLTTLRSNIFHDTIIQLLLTPFVRFTCRADFFCCFSSARLQP